ncbi:MAG: AraC family transcriptional regulator [Chitinophagaceae bacterium]
MKPLLFDVKSSLRNSIYIKDVKSKYLSDQFHFHNAYEIALILKGSGMRIVGDSIDNFSDGDLILLAPNLPHASYSDKKYHVKATSTKVHAIVVYFLPDWINDAHFNSKDFAPIKALLNEIKRGITVTKNTHAVVMNYLLQLRNADGLQSFIILFQILYAIARSNDYCCLSSPGYTNTYDEHNIKKIHTIYKYVMENFTRRILLNDIAAIAFMTPSAFCKYFKSKTNKTFTYFVNEIRIGHACQLIINKNMDISSICFECGFNNFTSFNKNFKQFTKITPSEYRTKFLLS